MALTLHLTHGEPIHVEGDQYLIPVTLELKNGETVVFHITIEVKHNAARTIAESLGENEVKHDFQQAIDSYFKKESVKAQSSEITTALITLKNNLEIPKGENKIRL